jgi:RNA polymerase sigma factor (sigma-70 family)
MQENGPSFSMPREYEPSFGNTEGWVLRQARRPAEPESDPARSRLCSVYWPPVFRFILRSGYSWHDAEDLTQEFFSRVLEHNSLRTAAQEKGKFRSFLVTLLKRFLADQRDRVRCQKRGGGARTISLDEGDTEFRRRIEPKSELDPERICERHWVDSLLQDAMARLERECAANGKSKIFQELKDLVTGDKDLSYAELSATLRLSQANVRVIVHRFRRRLRQLLCHAGSDRAQSNIGEDLLNVYGSP